ncbi:heme-thiolate peroxidase [Phytophthora cinnamomi]|nr:heme-thiolate peroxidase [Phytophthora cinnamomi]
MVSWFATLAFVATAFGVTQGYTTAENTELANAAATSVGEYYRPPSTMTSGRPGATTPFRRSPCPGLNTLANHGYLPRDGKNVTIKMVMAVAKDKFNIAEDLVTVMGALSPAVFDLNDLSKHNDPIEHDASMARSDSYFGEDPAVVTPSLINDVLSYGADGQVDVNDVAKIQSARITYGQQFNPNFDFSALPAFIAHTEAALFLRAFGGQNGNYCKTSFASTFFLREQFPSDWKKSPTQIKLADALVTVSYLGVTEM